MQPISTSNIRNQNSPRIQKELSEQRQKPEEATSNNIEGNSANSSEDVVTFSTPQTFTQVNPKPTIPSTPVSYPEKKALYKAFRGTRRFSVKA